MLPPQINLIHGPGCPVCVTPLELVDKAIALASLPDVIFTSYGDMLRVPGSSRDLFAVKAAGGMFASSILRWMRLRSPKTIRGRPSFSLPSALRQLPRPTPWQFCKPRRRDSPTSPYWSRMSPFSRHYGPDGLAGRAGGWFPSRRHVSTVMGYWSMSRWPKVSHSHRGNWLRAGRHPARHSRLRAAIGNRPVRGAQRLCPLGFARRQPTCQAVIRRVFEMTDRAWRGIGVIPCRATSCVSSLPPSMPNSASHKSSPSRRTSRRYASAGWYCKAARNRTNAQPLANSAPRKPARRDHGLVGGRLRGLLSLRAVSTRNTPREGYR